MRTAEADQLLDVILRKESLVIHFQPICSVRAKQVVGVEALCRCSDPATGRLVALDPLVQSATRRGLSIEVDRLFRRKALEAFAPLHRKSPNLALFVNFNASIVDEGVVGSGHFVELADRNNVNPGNIVIEIIESRVRNEAALRIFAAEQRKNGFLFAVDDVGAGHSNLQRIALIEPDVLKVDKTLVRGIDTQQYKQQLFAALVSMGHRLGAIVVAEGVETQAEALTTLNNGADLVQGYYVHAPGPLGAQDLESASLGLEPLAATFRENLTHALQIKQDEALESSHIAAIVRESLEEESPASFGQRLTQMIGTFDSVECAYVLGAQGRQISPTVCNPNKTGWRSQFIFRPAESGTDHSLKEYYAALANGVQSHLTQPYVSLATGRLGRTHSSRFTQASGSVYILCLDFDLDAWKF